MSFTFILWSPGCFAAVWIVRCGPTPQEGALVHLLGGAPSWGGSGLSDFISGFSLLAETKMKWKNNICEACIMYLALHLPLL